MNKFRKNIKVFFLLFIVLWSCKKDNNESEYLSPDQIESYLNTLQVLWYQNNLEIWEDRKSFKDSVKALDNDFYNYIQNYSYYVSSGLPIELLLTKDDRLITKFNDDFLINPLYEDNRLIEENRDNKVFVFPDLECDSPYTIYGFKELEIIKLNRLANDFSKLNGYVDSLQINFPFFVFSQIKLTPSNAFFLEKYKSDYQGLEDKIKEVEKELSLLMEDAPFIKEYDFIILILGRGK